MLSHALCISSTIYSFIKASGNHFHKLNYVLQSSTRCVYEVGIRNGDSACIYSKFAEEKMFYYDFRCARFIICIG